MFVSDEASFSGAFLRAIATSLNGVGAQGNYVHLTGVRGDAFTLTGQSLTFRNFVSAIQINALAVPEPATGLITITGVAGLARRRRHAA